MISPTCTRIATPQGSKFQHLMHTRDVRGYNYTRRNYSSYGHGLYVKFAVRRDYSSPAARALRRPRRAPRLLAPGHTLSTSTSPCTTTTRLRPHTLYVNLAVCHDYSSPAARALRQPHRALRVLVSTLPAAATTAPPPRIRVPRHVARPVTRLVAPLVVDYSASHRLVVDYFASTARPGASACRAACHAARRAARRRLLRLAQARHRLLRLRRASGCLGTSRRSSSTTPRRAVSSSTTPCAATSSCGHASSTSATPWGATTCLAATLALLRVRHAPPRRRLPVASCRPFISTNFPN
jgi:hypothetical protein